MAVHHSMLFPVPDGVTDDAAVLADPFSVSLTPSSASRRRPAGGPLVYGAGALGLTSVAVLRALHPDVEVAVVARFPAQAAMAARFGASCRAARAPALASSRRSPTGPAASCTRPLLGCHDPSRGLDVVYDTIAKPETLEMGSRLLAQRGTLVVIGVATPGRWESTPVYFKELTVVGSNSLRLRGGRGSRRHAIEHYFDLVTSGRVDLTGMVTHRFALEDWWGAMQALAHQDTSGALKVAFAPNGGAGPGTDQPVVRSVTGAPAA